MDTYFNTNGNCVRCGRCVIACQDKGEGFLGGIRDSRPYGRSDYVPCHHCTGKFNKIAPCKESCHYDAIEITRW